MLGFVLYFLLYCPLSFILALGKLICMTSLTLLKLRVSFDFLFPHSENNMNLSWNSGAWTKEKTLQPLSKPAGDVCSYSKDRFLGQNGVTPQITHERYKKRPTLPAHWLPERRLDSCGPEWKNNKGRIVSAYLTGVKFVFENIRRNNEQQITARAYQHINSHKLPFDGFYS